MNDYNLIFAIITALVSAGITYGALKNQINVNTSNIIDLQKLILEMSDIKQNIELNKKDVDTLKDHNSTNMGDIKEIKQAQNLMAVTMAQILEKLSAIEKKI